MAELSIETIEAVHGANSVRFRVDSVDARGGWRSPGPFQVVDAEEGRSYDVRVRLRNPESSVRLHVTSESAESRDPRTPMTEIVAPGETGENEWRELTYRYTVPPHYRNVRFEVNAVAPGTFWIDDVRIEPIGGG
jgi:hypothetical protein